MFYIKIENGYTSRDPRSESYNLYEDVNTFDVIVPLPIVISG